MPLLPVVNTNSILTSECEPGVPQVNLNMKFTTTRIFTCKKYFFLCSLPPLTLFHLTEYVVSWIIKHHFTMDTPNKI